MNRLGFPLHRFDAVLNQIRAFEHIYSLALMTGLVTADEPRGAG